MGLVCSLVGTCKFFKGKKIQTKINIFSTTKSPGLTAAVRLLSSKSKKVLTSERINSTNEQAKEQTND